MAPSPLPATSILVAGPEGFQNRTTMVNDGTGYLIASMRLPSAGTYSARIFVRTEGNDTYAADSEFEVFPNLPYRIRAVDTAADVLTGERVTLAFETVDPDTLATKDLRDLQVKFEHWSDDHVTFLGEKQADEVTKIGPGTFRVASTFAEAGMYHIRFASEAGGFNYADVPLLHIYAISPEQAGVAQEKDAPGAAAALAIVGMAAVALALRRR